MRYTPSIGKSGEQVESRSNRPLFFPLSKVWEDRQEEIDGQAPRQAHCPGARGVDRCQGGRLQGALRLRQDLPGARSRGPPRGKVFAGGP